MPGIMKSVYWCGPGSVSLPLFSCFIFSHERESMRLSVPHPGTIQTMLSKWGSSALVQYILRCRKWNFPKFWRNTPDRRRHCQPWQKSKPNLFPIAGDMFLFTRLSFIHLATGCTENPIKNLQASVFCDWYHSSYERVWDLLVRLSLRNVSAGKVSHRGPHSLPMICGVKHLPHSISRVQSVSQSNNYFPHSGASSQYKDVKRNRSCSPTECTNPDKNMHTCLPGAWAELWWNMSSFTEGTFKPGSSPMW